MKYLPIVLLALLTSCQKSPESFVSFKPTETQFEFVDAKGNVLVGYQHATYPAPEGQDPAYARSGFIHPVNTTQGQRLTQVQPADHYHHYGIWNPWTRVSFKGRIIDFWNLKDKKGTVRFAGLESSEQSEDSATIRVKHDHIVFNEDGSETTALKETQTVRVSKSPLPESYFLDIECEYRCATEEPFTIVEYRYGGLGWRANEAWNAQNSSVLTSEGIERDGSDGSLARWMIAQGNIDNANAGMAIMSHPDNYNHPEPLRIWPSSSHEGQLFVNVAPTKTKDWILEPGQTYTLKYRLLVFSGDIEASDVDSSWQNFAAN